MLYIILIITVLTTILLILSLSVLLIKSANGNSVEKQFEKVQEELIEITVDENIIKLWQLKDDYFRMKKVPVINTDASLVYDRIIIYFKSSNFKIGYIIDNMTYILLGELPSSYIEPKIGFKFGVMCKNNLGVDDIIKNETPVLKYYQYSKHFELNSIGYSIYKKHFAEISFGFLDDKMYVHRVHGVDKIENICITKEPITPFEKDYKGV